MPEIICIATILFLSVQLLDGVQRLSKYRRFRFFGGISQVDDEKSPMRPLLSLQEAEIRVHIRARSEKGCSDFGSVFSQALLQTFLRPCPSASTFRIAPVIHLRLV